MKKKLLWGLFLIFGCQIEPTHMKEEPTNQYDKNSVLMDTRSAFEFESFHISGSVNINSGDYLILKNAKPVKRILDPDITQIIERLAKRGISPDKKIILLSNKKDSDENKKWRWLLRQFGVYNVELAAFDQYREIYKTVTPQAPPAAVPVWEVKDAKSILKKSDQCFVKWSDEAC